MGGSLVFWQGDIYDAALVAITTFFVALLVFPGSQQLRCAALCGSGVESMGGLDLTVCVYVVFAPRHSFFIAKVQVLLCAIATGIVSTIGSTFMKVRQCGVG